MTAVLALLGAATVALMYVMVSRAQQGARGAAVRERAVLAVVSVAVAAVGVWGALKIAHDYSGGDGFMWAFLIVGVLCPIIDKHKGRLVGLLGDRNTTSV